MSQKQHTKSDEHSTFKTEEFPISDK